MVKAEGLWARHCSKAAKALLKALCCRVVGRCRHTDVLAALHDQCAAHHTRTHAALGLKQQPLWRIVNVGACSPCHECLVFDHLFLFDTYADRQVPMFSVNACM